MVRSEHVRRTHGTLRTVRSNRMHNDCMDSTDSIARPIDSRVADNDRTNSVPYASDDEVADAESHRFVRVPAMAALPLTDSDDASDILLAVPATVAAHHCCPLQRKYLRHLWIQQENSSYDFVCMRTWYFVCFTQNIETANRRTIGLCLNGCVQNLTEFIAWRWWRWRCVPSLRHIQCVFHIDSVEDAQPSTTAANWHNKHLPHVYPNNANSDRRRINRIFVKCKRKKLDSIWLCLRLIQIDLHFILCNLTKCNWHFHYFMKDSHTTTLAQHRYCRECAQHSRCASEKPIRKIQTHHQSGFIYHHTTIKSLSNAFLTHLFALSLSFYPSLPLRYSLILFFNIHSICIPASFIRKISVLVTINK